MLLGEEKLILKRIFLLICLFTMLICGIAGTAMAKGLDDGIPPKWIAIKAYENGMFYLDANHIEKQGDPEMAMVRIRYLRPNLANPLFMVQVFDRDSREAAVVLAAAGEKILYSAHHD